MNPTHPDRKTPRRGISVAIRIGLIALLSAAGAALGASGCLVRPLCDDCRPQTTNIFVDTIIQKSVDKIDLLFMIDNSISMADKQAVLKDAVPDLVQRLVNPDCVAEADGLTRGNTPADPNAACAAGFVREFNAIKNIHIGVITSSLGGHGAALCRGADGVPPPAGIKAEQQDDHGHLIGTRPRFRTAAIGQPADPNGFLDWNPNEGRGNVGAFTTTFQAMTSAAGEFGCGFEASLEAIYRFMMDPNPPRDVIEAPCPQDPTNNCATPTGRDDALLAQRAEFLRPDSLVAVVLLSDENDCSIRDSQQYYFAARQDVTLKQGSQQCATNPNDRCCYSCLTSPPAGCQPDPNCGTQNPTVDAKINLRCFEQKRRYGLDFLYPVQRYVNALSEPRLCLARADLGVEGCDPAAVQTNPLFMDLKGGAGVPRDPSLVFFAGIIGVPWQDIQATDMKDKDGNIIPVPGTDLRYKTAAELIATLTWDTILGDPTPEPPGTAPRLAGDVLMWESIGPRGGNGPYGPGGTGQLAVPGSPVDANAANGHEWNNTGLDDLQYACIFPLQAPRDCAALEAQNPDPMPGCDCPTGSDLEQNPLCQQGNAFTTTQYRAKAYPGLRELEVLKEFGNNSIVASICARNLSNPSAQDYGYRPAVDAIVERLKEALTGRCLPRKLVPGDDNQIPCSIIEAVPRLEGCDPAKGRLDPAAEGHAKVVGPARARLKESGYCGSGPGLVPCAQFQLCEIRQLQGPPKEQCLLDQPYLLEPGWCYVDPDNGIGAETLVAKCQATERRILRFVDPQNQTPAHDARVLIACFGASLDDEGAGGAAAAAMP